MDLDIKKDLVSNWFKLLQDAFCNDFNILENDKADGTSEENSIFEGRGVLPEIPFESLPEIGFALGLSVFSGVWARWEAFGKKAVFGDQEEEEREGQGGGAGRAHLFAAHFCRPTTSDDHSN